MDFWSWPNSNIVEVVRLVASIMLAVGVLLSFLSLQSTRRSLRMSAKQNEVSILHDVQNRWNEIYSSRNRLRGSDFTRTNWHSMEVNDILTSKEWLEVVRPVANFYEFIGLVVFKGYIQLDTVLVLVTMDEQSRERAAPLIDALKAHYRDDLYVFWDYLIDESRKVKASRPIRSNS